MISTYHRPQTLDEAIALLSEPNTFPLGGGTLLSKPTADSVQVVDLQSLGLDFLNQKGNDLEIGATCTLQSLLESEHCLEAMKAALKFEAPLNVRNMATAAGTLVSGDGRSTFVTALLALDAKVTTSGGQFATGEFILSRPKGLITSITIPLNVKFAFQSVSKTPADKPIVCAALSQWNSGRTRLALGGYGRTPMLAMDGTEADGLETAARNAFHEAGDDWASAEYRMEMAYVLSRRCLEES